MSGASPIRASNADRSFIADVLRDQVAAGRLSLDEFEERSAAAYAATWLDDLHPLVADLPVSLEGRLPVKVADVEVSDASAVRPARSKNRALVDFFTGPMGMWTGVMLVFLLIWVVVALTSLNAAFLFPLLLIVPWALALLSFAIIRRDRARREQARRDRE